MRRRKLYISSSCNNKFASYVVEQIGNLWRWMFHLAQQVSGDLQLLIMWYSRIKFF